MNQRLGDQFKWISKAYFGSKKLQLNEICLPMLRTLRFADLFWLSTLMGSLNGSKNGRSSSILSLRRKSEKKCQFPLTK